MAAYYDGDMMGHATRLDGNTVTREQIETLLQEAGQAGDRKQVKLCKEALSGSFSARCRCADAINEARAQR